MPKFLVGLYFTFRADYEVEEPDEAAAREEAHRLNSLESDPEMLTHTSEAIELVDTLIESIGVTP